MKPRIPEFDFDVDAVIADYARRYIEDGHCHETLDDAAEQVALDLKMPDAKEWFKKAVREIQHEYTGAK